MPCVCGVCGCRFDLPRAAACAERGSALCPICGSHNIYSINDAAIAVPPQLAASVRASVWGRGS